MIFLYIYMKETIVILQYIDNNKTLKKDGKKNCVSWRYKN